MEFDDLDSLKEALEFNRAVSEVVSSAIPPTSKL